MDQSVIIVLPVSRKDYLPGVFTALEMMECDREKVSLLVMVDGDMDLFIEARNRTMESKFNQKLCVQFKSKHKLKHYDILGRRMRISDIHNQAKQHMWESEFVFGVEDDTIIPSHSLKKLLQDYWMYPYAGFIQGIELGRWGVPYAGAWKANDVYEPTEITSVVPLASGVSEVDAGGFYCFLTKMKTYEAHEFKPFDNNNLGPDVDFGIALRAQGMMNYTDWDVSCLHRTKDKDITLLNTTPKTVVFKKNDHRWRQSHKN